jgi:hypothetical protein
MQRWSKLFVPTLSEAPADAQVTSHKLLLWSYIRQLGTGIFAYICFGLVILVVGYPAFGTDKPFVRVRWKEAELRIVYKGKTITYDFGSPEGLSPETKYQRLFLAAMDKVTTDYLEQKDGVVYMILDIQGPSRGREAASSQCGAGSEQAKALFVFDQDGEVKAPTFVLYESCLVNIYADSTHFKSPIDALGMSLAKIQFIRSPQPIDRKNPTRGAQLIVVHAAFDPAHPESGIKTDQACFLFEPWQTSGQRIPCPG